MEETELRSHTKCNVTLKSKAGVVEQSCNLEGHSIIKSCHLKRLVTYSKKTHVDMDRSIILCGATSAGKRKIANALSNNRKGFKPIINIARNVMTKDSITREDILESLKTEKKEKFLQLQRHIIREQNNLESEGGPFISANGINPLAFARYYVDREAADQLAQDSATRDCLKRYRECSVLALRPLVEPTDDRTHLMQTSEEQNEFTQVLCDLLQEYGIHY